MAASILVRGGAAKEDLGGAKHGAPGQGCAICRALLGVPVRQGTIRKVEDLITVMSDLGEEARHVLVTAMSATTVVCLREGIPKKADRTNG